MNTRMRILTAAAGALLGGCTGPALPPADLPPDIPAVMAGREAIRIEGDDPLLGLEPGTVMDDPSGLAGCWGAYSVLTADEEAEGFIAPDTPLFDAYDFWQFDAAAGTSDYQAAVDSAPSGALLPGAGGFSSAYRELGTYQIVSGNRLVLTSLPDDIYMTNLETGELQSMPEYLAWSWEQYPPEDGQAPPELSESYETVYLFTLAGDRLVLVPVWDEEDGSESVHPEEAQVLVRMGCP